MNQTALLIDCFNPPGSPDRSSLRQRRGPKSGLAHISGPFAVYPPKGEIIVSVRGSSSESNELSSDECFVGVWSIEDNGDVPPRWTIGGPKGILRMVRGVDLDPKNKSVIVTDKRLNAVLTFSFPEMF